MPVKVKLFDASELVSGGVARAYVLAYLSSTSPRVLGLLFSLFRKNCNFADARKDLLHTLQQASKLNRFPAFCAVVVGGSKILQVPLYRAISVLNQRVRDGRFRLEAEYCRLLARFLAALVASAVGFQLINSQSRSSGTSNLQNAADAAKDSTAYDIQIDFVPSEGTLRRKEQPRRESKIPLGMPPLSVKVVAAQPLSMAMGIPLAGKTIDLTLFAFVRAADVLVQSLKGSAPASNRISRFVSKAAAPFLFAASSATIMHAWFYAPSRLPYTYVKWIDRLAELDERLLHALREARYGNFIYGKETGIGPLLGSMCKDYGLPEEWGNPASTIPVPCEVVHHGCGPNCELHALWRFWKSWRRALGVYGPLQAIILLRMLRNKSSGRLQAVTKVSLDAARSSAFLGSFVALFYYGVCLTRTRIGPKILSYETVTPQMYDGGLCVAGGCALCGWSVLFEAARRRVELMLFVLPRALGVWFPRRYPLEYRWREQITFAISAAVVLTAVQEQPEKVRGVFGKVLQQVIVS